MLGQAAKLFRDPLQIAGTTVFIMNIIFIKMYRTDKENSITMISQLWF